MSAYHLTSAANAAELAIKIKDFCVSVGWSAEFVDVSGSKWLVYTASMQRVAIFDEGAALRFQGVYTDAGYSLAAHVSEMKFYAELTMPEVHLLHYSNPDVIYIIMKFSDGTYRQGVLGQIAKFGNWTGGSVHHLSDHALDGDGDADKWPSGDVKNTRLFGGYSARGGIMVENGEGPDWRPFYRGNLSSDHHCIFGVSDAVAHVVSSDPAFDQCYWVMQNSHSDFNWSSHLVTIPIHVSRPNGVLSPLGYAPHIRMTKGITLTPGELITVGADQWRCFPIIRRGAPGVNTAGSYDYFYCFYVDAGQTTPVSV